MANVSGSTLIPRQETVIVCINVLPLVFTRASLTESCPWHVEWSTSSYGLFLRNIVSNQRYRPMFIGCPEVYISKKEENSVRQLLLHQFNCIPVFLDTNTAHRHFQGFCKGVLWPIFHNVVDVYNSAELKLDDFKEENNTNETTLSNDTDNTSVWQAPASWNPASQDKCWYEYCQVNRIFAKKVIENWQTGNIIWIHDYSLLVLASYLLRKLHGGSIAIFMHVPFPSSEIFRTLTVRTELLRAMLCANHIGFLVFEHARHFLTACKRLLGLNYKTSQNGMLAIEYSGRLVLITCSHCGTELNHMNDLLNRLDTDTRALQLKEKFAPIIASKSCIITSVDRLEGLTGVPLKLRAYERFLATYPSKRKETVLVQYGISLDCRPNDYHQTQRYVEKFVAEINRRWGEPNAPVVIYEERKNMIAQERMVLWHTGHIFLDTCVRGGLSMLPFEFLAAHHENRSTTAGVLIISEFSCYSRILNGALLANPWKADDVVAAIVKAIEMPLYEMRSRAELNFQFLIDNPVSEWGSRMLVDIESAAVSPKAKRNGSGNDFVEIGFGFDYRVMQFTPGFAPLPINETIKAYSSASRRLLLLDYGGSLSWTLCVVDDEASMNFYKQDEGTTNRLASVRKYDGQVRAPVGAETKANLAALCGDPANVVVIWSNARRIELENEFGCIPGLNLISDSGYFIRKADTAIWESLYADSSHDFSWKTIVTNIIKTYVARTNGSFLLVNDTSVTYDYHNCDPEYGEMQAAELYEQLSLLLKREKTTIARGKGFVEVHRFGVNKAIAASMLLNFCKDKVSIPDFILCIGDDESDEQAYRTIRAFSEAEKTTNIITCTVGKKPSCAQYYLDSVTEVVSLLETLSNVRGRVRRASCPPGGTELRQMEAISFQRQYQLGGRIICPVFVRNLSKEFTKAISTANLEEFCVDHFNPALLTSPRNEDEKEEKRNGYTKIDLMEGIVVGLFVGFIIRHNWQQDVIPDDHGGVVPNNSRMIIICILGIQNGQPEKLLYGTDYNGTVCGTGDMIHSIYVYYPRINQDMEQQIAKGIQPIDMKFYGLCVNTCPLINTYICSYQAEALIRMNNPGETEQGLDIKRKTRAELQKNTWNTQDCWLVSLPSDVIAFRCLPKEITSENSTQICVQPNDSPEYYTIQNGIQKPNEKCQVSMTITETKTTGQANSNPIFEKLQSIGAMFGRFVGDVKKTFLQILAAGGGLALGLGWLFLFLMRFCASCLIWFVLIAVVLLLGILSTFFLVKGGIIHSNHVASIASAIQSASSVSVQVPASLSQSQSNTQVFQGAAVVSILFTVIALLVVCFMRKRIKIAIGIIREASHAIQRLPFLVLFPMVPVVLILGLFIYATVIGAYIYSADGNISLDTSLVSTNQGNGSLTEQWASQLNATTSIIQPKTLMKIMVAYHFFGFLWTNQLIQAISMTTIAGAVCKYYWSREHCPRNGSFPNIFQL